MFVIVFMVNQLKCHHYFITKNIYYKITFITICILILILVTNLIEMASTFHTNLSPILILSKSFGLIDIKYTVEPSGLLVRNLNSTFHVVQEIIRMIVLLICTFIYFDSFDSDVHLLQMINIIRFWFVIIAGRLSTIQIIKYLLTSFINELLKNVITVLILKLGFFSST